MEILSKVTSKYVDIDKIIQDRIQKGSIKKDLPWLSELKEFKYSDLKDLGKLSEKEPEHDTETLLKYYWLR